MNSPKEIANNYIAIGKGKVNTPVAKMFVLGILAGIFIAFGGVASTAAAVSIPLASVGKFLGACIFPGGLTMVLLAGSELFTGNCLLVIPLCKKEITLYTLAIWSVELVLLQSVYSAIRLVFLTTVLLLL